MVAVPEPDARRGVYGISVAAELVGMGVQNLRAYEARGLLEPERTEGGTRRYSADDLDRLRRIGDLLDAGLNLAGIGMVLDLEAQNTRLRAEKEGTAMAGQDLDPTQQVPEADLLDQRAPVDPHSLGDPEAVPVMPEPLPDDVDEADRMEQLTPVLGDDEDEYPNPPPP